MGGGGGGAAGGAEIITGGGDGPRDIFGGDCFLFAWLWEVNSLEYWLCLIGGWSPSLKVEDVSVLELSIRHLLILFSVYCEII